MYEKKATLVLACSLMSLFSLHADVETAAPLNPISDLKHEYSTSFTAFSGKVKGNKVRMRASAALESAVVRETGAGEMFAIVGEEKEFYKVQPPRGTKGYVFRTFILDNTVEGDRVNVRLHPDTDSPILAQLHAGEKVHASVCEANTKWLEIALPKTAHFYIAKEYVENVGPVDLIAQVELRRETASHLLNSVFHFANAEIQKPFDEIALDQIHQKFTALIHDFSDLSDIVAKAKEIENTLEETYVQKKICFLESKADRTMATRELDPQVVQKLNQLGKEFKVEFKETAINQTGTAASNTMGHSAVANNALITDKMRVWQSFEESLYHLWAATHEGKSIEEFYEEENANATVLAGIVETYNRPVKNLPGDYILRLENLPVAFLYSTKINLQEYVGKRVRLISASRPNNNFAFPAYFVLSVE